jgi:hypothetical protein
MVGSSVRPCERQGRKCVVIRRTYGAIHRGRGRNRALGTAVARVGGVLDGDLIRGRRAGLGVSGGENWQNEGSELGMHLERAGE